jgi:hypothetical protein
VHAFESEWLLSPGLDEPVEGFDVSHVMEVVQDSEVDAGQVLSRL